MLEADEAMDEVGVTLGQNGDEIVNFNGPLARVRIVKCSANSG